MQLFANNASSTLASAVNATDNTLVLASGEGTRFPAPSGEDYFLLTLTQGAGLESSWEIVKCTARAGDSLTVDRAQENTSGLVWSAGTKADLRITAAVMGTAITPTIWGSIPDQPPVIAAGADAAAARTAIGAGTSNLAEAPSDGKTYGRKNAAWAVVVTPADTQTLTNKTLTGYTETVYNLTGTVIAVANGSIQTKTLSANTTFTESLADGQSVILGITAGAYSVTWPSVTWSKIGGSGVAPTLTSSGVNWIILWQVGGVVRGSFMGTA